MPKSGNGRNIIIRNIAVPAVILFLIASAAFLTFQVRLHLPVRSLSGISPSRVHIGDSAVYFVKVSAPVGTELDLSETQITPEGVEFKGLHVINVVTYGRKIAERRSVATAYDTGRFEMPSLTVKYRKTPSSGWVSFQSDPVFLDVPSITNTSIPDTKTDRVKVSSSIYGTVPDPGPSGSNMGTSDLVDMPIRLAISDRLPVRVPKTPQGRFLNLLYIVIGSAVIFFLAIVIIAFIWFLREKPRPTPYESAVRSLLRLKKTKIAEPGHYKEFFSVLDAVIREYAGVRFGMPSVKMTAKEFAGYLSLRDDISPEMKEYLIQRILLCDTVKYSDVVPSIPELDTSIEKDMEFLKIASGINEGGEKS